MTPIGALLVSAVRAAAPELHYEEVPAILEGEQVVPLIFEEKAGFTMKCETAKLATTVGAKTSTGMTLEPTFGKCKFMALDAEFITNGCGLFFSLVGASNPPTAKMNVTCPGAAGMEVISKSLQCTIKIGGQKGIAHATFANGGANQTRDVTISIVTDEVKYEEVGEQCPTQGFQEFGEYSGTVTLKAYKDAGGVKGAQMGMWVE